MSIHESDWMDFPHGAKVMFPENLPTTKKYRGFMKNPRNHRFMMIDRMSIVLTNGTSQCPFFIGVIIPTSVDTADAVRLAEVSKEAELNAQATSAPEEGAEGDKDDHDDGKAGWGLDIVAWPPMVGRYPFLHGYGKNTYQLQDLANNVAGADTKIYDESVNFYEISGFSDVPNEFAGLSPEELLDHMSDLAVAKKVGEAIIKKIGELVRTSKKLRTNMAKTYTAKNCPKALKEEFPNATAYVDKQMKGIVDMITDERCFFQSGSDGKPCPYDVFKFFHRIVSRTLPKGGSSKIMAQKRIEEAKKFKLGGPLDFARRQAELGHYVKRFNLRWLKKGYPPVYPELKDHAVQKVFDGAMIVPITRITVTLPTEQKKTIRAEIVQMDVQELTSEIRKEEFHNEEFFMKDDNRERKPTETAVAPPPAQDTDKESDAGSEEGSEEEGGGDGDGTSDAMEGVTKQQEATPAPPPASPVKADKGKGTKRKEPTADPKGDDAAPSKAKKGKTA